MSYSNYKKAFKQLRIKPAKLKKFIKHNSPKEKKFGVATKRCLLCGRIGGHISSYGLNLCRQCFRLNAKKMGFKKYS
jgi:small subunit ribosomal protein S14